MLALSDFIVLLLVGISEHRQKDVQKKVIGEKKIQRSNLRAWSAEIKSKKKIFPLYIANQYGSRSVKFFNIVSGGGFHENRFAEKQVATQEGETPLQCPNGNSKLN